MRPDSHGHPDATACTAVIRWPVGSQPALLEAGNWLLPGLRSLYFSSSLMEVVLGELRSPHGGSAGTCRTVLRP